MRKLMAAFAMVLVAGLPARSWAMLGFENITYDGSLEVSGVHADNEKDLKTNASPSDRHSDVDTRVRLGMNAPITDDVSGRLEFTRTGSRWGRNFSGTAGAGNSLQDEQNNIRINNAFFDITLAGWRWRAGRQYVGNEGDLVWFIGPRQDDILSLDAIDGLDVRRAWDRVIIDVFGGKARDNNPQGAANDVGEVSLKNVTATFPNVLPNSNIWAGAIWGSNSNGTDNSDRTSLQIYRVGINGGVRENFFTYRAEVLANGGDNKVLQPIGGSKIKYKGKALDLGAGLNLAESSAGGVSFGGDFLWTSGDKNRTDNDDKSFRDLNAVGVVSTDRYYGEIFGRSNVLSFVPLGEGIDSGAQGTGYTIIHLNALFKPAFAPKTWARLDYYNFGATENKVTLVPGGPTTNVGDYGTEWDLTLGYRHSDNVGFEAGYAMLNPKDALKAINGTTASDNITKWFARTKIAWGTTAASK